MTKKLDEVCQKYNINDAQKRFAEAYVELGNNTKAYMKAYPGVKEDTAKANGSRLLTDANVVRYIKDLRIGQSKVFIMTVEEAQKLLTEIAFEETSCKRDKINAIDKLLKSSGAYLEDKKTDTNINISLQGSMSEWSK